MTAGRGAMYGSPPTTWTLIRMVLGVRVVGGGTGVRIHWARRTTGPSRLSNQIGGPWTIGQDHDGLVFDPGRSFEDLWTFPPRHHERRSGSLLRFASHV